ncbi:MULTISPECIES: ATP12 family chaperone protein [unclassified Meridianimarinicoccus]|uniref:ATP12 family chaperone protein n=1 Tax=unclassified Meridianimarinicoccus TaxID=2923344 RepID=UPI001866B183|nr:ATP12 family protein [Fluviibacterium sp. MJW13]
MTEWAQKRFWKETSVEPAEGGYTVRLDGRGIRTPSKAPLIVPTEALARAMADEWDAQEEAIQPATMPMTRSSNSAVDKVAVQFTEVADLLAAYGESDLLCYRAEHPEELIQRQAAAWDPVLDWAAREFDAQLNVASGVMFVPQPESSIAALRRKTHALSHWQLTAFHDLVALTGSLVLGFASLDPRWNRKDIWAWSRLDEDWQAEQWGKDEEAQEAAALKAQAFADAARFYDLVTG